MFTAFFYLDDVCIQIKRKIIIINAETYEMKIDGISKFKRIYTYGGNREIVITVWQGKCGKLK